jgi:eukaryotic-like serine/threonine-protein kinase
MSLAPKLRRSAAATALALLVLSSSRDGASAPSPQEAPVADRTRASGRVRFSVVPAGARIWVEGIETSWFGRTLLLGVGQHRIRAEVPGSRCCKPWSGVVRISATSLADDPQSVVIPLEISPARLVLVDAPQAAELQCAAIGVVAGLGELVTVRLRQPEWSGWCDFRNGDVVTRSLVRVAAGEINAVPWIEERTE